MGCPAGDRAIAALRPPEHVMRLQRMGASFQTRLSFMRQLIRRMRSERWRFERLRFDLDARGYGTAVYAARGPQRTYSLIAYTHEIRPEQRTDRVIAEAWDATFSFFDGVPDDADIERLRANTPGQENGRFRSSELTLARANKSMRLFEHVVESLAAGRQPDAARACTGPAGATPRGASATVAALENVADGVTAKGRILPFSHVLICCFESKG